MKEQQMHNEPNGDGPDINPATGLPLIEDTYIDVGGSPYGQDIHPPVWLPPAPEPYWPPADCGDGW